MPDIALAPGTLDLSKDRKKIIEQQVKTLGDGINQLNGKRHEDATNAINAKYNALGGIDGFAGAPVMGVSTCADNVGFKAIYSGATIYFLPGIGAFEVHGSIRDEYSRRGAERGRLGYPISDEQELPDKLGRSNQFQHGQLVWTRRSGHVDFQEDPVPDAVTFGGDYTTTDLPLGGWIKLVMRKDGAFTFSSHMHNSGFDNIGYAITAVAMTPAGIAFTAQLTGNTEGTSAGLPFGTPNRESDLFQNGTNAAISANWGEALMATWTVRVDTQDKLKAGLEKILNDTLGKLAEELEKDVVKLVVALISL